MACSRGKAAPDDQTKLRLFASSGGYCQHPDCLRELFVDAASQSIHIAEMAHIIAASEDGPRAVANMSAARRGRYENLILLCPACHTISDRAVVRYPDA